MKIRPKEFISGGIAKVFLFVLLITDGTASGHVVNFNNAAAYQYLLHQPVPSTFRIAAGGNAASIYVATDEKADNLKIAKSVAYIRKEVNLNL